MISFYCGVNETKWNHHPCKPGPLSCIAPVYGATESSKRENSVVVPPDTRIIQDSGAFSDGPASRLTFAEAYDRLLYHSDKYGYTDQITHRASYDLLIDEKWTGGARSKQRWTETDAERAVKETVAAARYAVKRRKGEGLVLSARGVSSQQYLDCARQIAPLLDNARDIFGLGGWCITGKMPKQMMPVFRETIRRVIPFLSTQGIRRVHIWGVVYAPALGELLWLCDQFGIQVSTDSTGPSTRPAMGTWGYMGWSDPNYTRPPVETRGLHRALHVALTREWLANFRNTPWYQAPAGDSALQTVLC